jgi:two-component system LytT family response regulator
MSKLRAVIVDDEMHCRENLKLLVEDFCENIEVLATAENATDAKEKIRDLEPDVVFLDVMMPNGDGFSVLKSFEKRDFSVIFTTAHNEYAIKAIKESAVDYLEKPINIDDLQAAVAKLQKNKGSEDLSLSKINALIQAASSQQNPQKLAVPTSNGLVMVNTEEIIHLEASESYTTLFLSTGKRLVSSKTIKVYEDHLSPKDFYRVHKSHIINVTHHLKEFNRTEGNMAVMSDGTHVPVSRRKVTEFVDYISTF